MVDKTGYDYYFYGTPGGGFLNFGGTPDNPLVGVYTSAGDGNDVVFGHNIRNFYISGGYNPSGHDVVSVAKGDFGTVSLYGTSEVLVKHSAAVDVLLDDGRVTVDGSSATRAVFFGSRDNIFKETNSTGSDVRMSGGDDTVQITVSSLMDSRVSPQFLGDFQTGPGHDAVEIDLWSAPPGQYDVNLNDFTVGADRLSVFGPGPMNYQVADGHLWATSFDPTTGAPVVLSVGMPSGNLPSSGNLPDYEYWNRFGGSEWGGKG